MNRHLVKNNDPESLVQFMQSINKFFNLEKSEEDTKKIIDSERIFEKICLELLEIGYDIHEGDDFMFRIAAERGYYDAAKKLINCRANVIAQDHSALRMSSINGHEKIVQLIFDTESHISPPILQLCCSLAMAYGYIDTVKIFLKNGLDINYNNGEIFINACGIGLTNVVKFLIDSGINLELYGNQALCYAIRFNHIDIVRTLIQEGVDIHFNNEIALMTIMQSADHDYLEIIKLLVEAGADYHIHNEFLFNHVISTNNNTVAKYLISLGITDAYKNVLLTIAVHSKNYEIVQYLLDIGANPCAMNGLLLRLQIIPSVYSINIIRLFLEYGVHNCDSTILDELLRFGQDNNHPELVELVIEYGVEPSSG